MARYNPPRTLNRPWLALVLEADPTYHADRRREVEYDFGIRKFYANTTERGAYGIPAEFDDEFADEDFATLAGANRAQNGF